MRAIITALLIAAYGNLYSQMATNSYPDSNGELWGIVDTTGKTIVPYEYDYIYSNYNNTVTHTLVKNEKKGLVDEFGKVLLECKYDKIEFLYILDADIAVFSDKTGKKGACSVRSGKSTECIFDEIYKPMHSGKTFLLLKKGELYGLADLDAEIMLEPEYYAIYVSEFESQFYNGNRVVKVEKEKQPGTDYSQVPDWEVHKYFSDGVFDLDENYFMIPIAEDHIILFNDLILIAKDDLYGIFYTDKSPEFIFKNVEEKSFTVAERLVYTYILDDKYIVIDNNLMGSYDSFDFSETSEGFISPEKDGKWGLISTLGAKEVIPCIYDNPVEVEKSAFVFDSDITIATGIKGEMSFRLDTLGRILYYAYEGRVVTKDNKSGYAYYNSDLDIEVLTIPCEYDKAELFMPDLWETDVLLVSKNGKIGLINTRNEVIIPVDKLRIERLMDTFEKPAIWYSDGTTSGIYFMDVKKTMGPDILSYEYMETSGTVLVITRNKQKKYELWSRDYEKITNDSYDKLYTSENENSYGQYYFYTKKDKKFGLLSPTGEKIIDNIYDNLSYMEIDDYYGNTFFYSLKNGKMGIVNSTGKVIVDNKYDDIQFTDQFDDFNLIFKVKLNGKWGIADSNNVELLKPEFDNFDYIYPWAPIAKNKLYGYLDNSMHLVIECKYEEADDLSSDYAVVKYKGLKGVINKKDEFLIKPSYKDIYYCGNNSLFVFSEGKWGVMDTSEKWIIKPSYTETGSRWTGTNYYFVKKDGKWGIVDYTTSKELCKFIYDGISSNTWNKNAMIMKNKKYGFLSPEGTEVVPCEYDDLKPYADNGLFYAAKNGKYGFIDEKNNVKIPFEYGESIGFTDGYAGISRSGKWGVIDTAGKAISPFDYDKITYNDGKYAIAVKGKKFGVITITGEEVYPFEYEKISNSGSSFWYQKTKKDTGYLDKK